MLLIDSGCFTLVWDIPLSTNRLNLINDTAAAVIDDSFTDNWHSGCHTGKRNFSSVK